MLHRPSAPINSLQAFKMNAGLHGSAVALAVEHSSTAGRKLGKVHSEAKAKAAQANGKHGGRPLGS